jgi:hypothetical protein
MKQRSKSNAVAIFIGVLLTAVFVIGLTVTNNPDAFNVKYRYDFALDQFKEFCASWYVLAGVIGIPTLVISLVISLVRESREK